MLKFVLSALLLAIIALGCVIPPARAQKVLFRFDGSQEGEILGAVVANLGDLDGDGIADIGVSAPLARKEPHPSGRVVVYSGSSGAQLFQIGPVDPRGMCWAMASAGDMDGDGVPDILVGTPFSAPPISLPSGLLYGAGRALVYSGRTRELFFLFDGEDQGGQLGHSVSIVRNFRSEQVPAMLLGAPYASADGQTGVGSVFVRSGSNGEVIFRFDGLNPGDYLGWAVAGVDDLNGDAAEDMILSAPFASPGGLEGAGIVFVRSGASGELLFQFDGIEVGDHFGSALAVAGDLDGDGVPEIMIAAPDASPEGRTQAGSVFVYSGAAGKLVHRLDGPERYDGFGAAMAGRGDVDGDQVPDLIVGAPTASPDGRVGAGSAFVFSGATGNLIFRIDGSVSGENLGTSVAAAGDLNDSGRSAVIVGVPYASPAGQAGAGSVLVLVYP